MAITMVQVRGHYEDAHRTLRTGSVTLIPSFAISNGATTITQVPVTADIVNGDVSITVAADDDTATTPTGMAYQVIEALDVPDGPPLVTKYAITVRASDAVAGIDLATAPRAVAPLPQYSAYITQITGDARYVQYTGGTMTGALALPALKMTTGPANGSVLTSDGTGNASWQAPGAVSGTDWINVKTYGAKGNGTTDDTAAIQAALNACPVGGVVYLPAGTYATTAPLIIPPGVHLAGTLGTIIDASTCAIKPLASFAGSAVIQMLDQTGGGYSIKSNYQQITDITIDGSSLVAANVDGIQSNGAVGQVRIRNVMIYHVTGNGINAINLGTSRSPGAWTGTQITAAGCVLNGFNIAMADSTWIALEALGAHQYGFNLTSTCPNTHFTDCRAEWSGLDGFSITGNQWNGNGSGGCQFTGCSTDRNGHNGVSISATGPTPVIFTGLMLRRDGRLSTTAGYASFSVNSGSNVPVIVDGVTVYPGVDDPGTGLSTPQYGFSITGASSNVVLASGVIQGVTAGIFDDGTNTNWFRSPNVLEATGNSNAQTFVNPRLSTDATGKLAWGSAGAANPDTNLYRSGVGTLKTDSFFVMSSGQSGGNFSTFSTSAKALSAGTAGGGLAVKEGTNARMGTLTLTGATPVVVSNTSVTATSRIFLTANAPGGTPGHFWVSARTAGTSFSVTGTAGDTSTVAWMIVEPA